MLRHIATQDLFYFQNGTYKLHNLTVKSLEKRCYHWYDKYSWDDKYLQQCQPNLH